MSRRLPRRDNKLLDLQEVLEVLSDSENDNGNEHSENDPDWESCSQVSDDSDYLGGEKYKKTKYIKFYGKETKAYLITVPELHDTVGNIPTVRDPGGMTSYKPDPASMTIDVPDPAGMTPDVPDPTGMILDVPDPASMNPDVPDPAGMTPDVPDPASMTPDVPDPVGMTLDVPDPASMTPDVPDPASMNPGLPDPALMTPDVPDPASMNPGLPDPASMNPDVPDPASMTPDVPDPALMTPDVPDPASMTPDVPDPASMNPDVPDPAGMTPDVPDPASMTPDVPDPASMNPGLPDPALMTPDVPDPASMNPGLPDPASMNPDVPDPASMTPDVPDPALMTPDVPDPASMTPDVPDPASMNPDVPDPAGMTPDVPDPASMTPDVPDPASMNPGLPDPASINPGLPDPALMTPDVPDPASMNPSLPDPASMNPGLPDPAGMTPDVPDPASMTPDVPDPASMNPGLPDPAGMTPDVPDPVGMILDVPDPASMNPDVPDPAGMTPDVPDPVGMNPGVLYSAGMTPNVSQNSINIANVDKDKENEVGSRKRLSRRDKWNRIIAKESKNRGREYISSRGNVVPARQMKPANCSVRKCKRCCEEKIKEDERQAIFNHYWELGSYQRQQDYLASHVTKVPVKQRTSSESSRRQSTYEYTFTLNNLKVQVCREFFCATIGETKEKIKYHREMKTNLGLTREDKRGKHNKRKVISKTSMELIRAHIKSYPAVESHYSRSRSKRKYLPSGLTIQSMYRDYVKHCQKRNIIPEKDCIYRRTFCQEFNYGFHKPKKDLCKLCHLYRNANTKHKRDMQDKYNTHIRNKIRARELKSKDKELSMNNNNNYVVASFDLQKVLYCPSGQVGELYYKRKLANYNLTVYNMTASSGFCYFWNEAEGKRGACEIASCLWKWLKVLDLGVKKVTLYSDSCPGQNKNIIIASMFLAAVKSLHIEEINQKFLEPGHTQMEVDSIHACIERAANNVPIYVPNDWLAVASLAKRTGRPYIVNKLQCEDIKNWKNVSKELIVNKHKINEGTLNWRQVKWLRFKKTDPELIEVKCHLEEEEPFQQLHVRKNTKGRKVTVATIQKLLTVPLYVEGELKLSDAKQKDLLSLCKSGTIPQLYHEFYYNLASSPEVRDCLNEPDVEDSEAEEEAETDFVQSG